jgi:hypothetical protein
MRNTSKVLVRKADGKRPLGRIGVDRRIILKSILKEQFMKIWTGFVSLRIQTSDAI